MILLGSTTKAIASNTGYQLIGKIISMSITVVATIIIARIYGRASYGEFNLMQNIPALFFIIADFGINAIATRELAKDFSKAEKYLGNILIIRFAISIILIIFVGGSLYFMPYSDSLRFGIQLGLLLVLTQALYATTNIIFQVKLRYDYSTIGYVLGSLVVLGLVLVLSYYRASIVWVNFSYVIGGLVTFFVNIYFITRFINLRIKLNIDPNLWKFLFLQSLPLGLMFIFSQINFKVDSIMLSVLKVPENLGLTQNETVGIYGLSFKIFEVALVIPTFFMNAVYPIYVRHLQQDKKQFKKTFFKTIWALLGVGIIGALIGIVFSDFAIRIIGGAEFGDSVGVLRVLLIGLPIFYVTQPISWFIVTLGEQKFLPWVYIISSVFNFVGNLIFIPIYSFYAAAVLTWISELIVLIVLIYFAYRAWQNYSISNA